MQVGAKRDAHFGGGGRGGVEKPRLVSLFSRPPAHGVGVLEPTS